MILIATDLCSDLSDLTKIPQLDITLWYKERGNELRVYLSESGDLSGDKQWEVLIFSLKYPPDDEIYPCYYKNTPDCSVHQHNALTGKEDFLPEVFRRCINARREDRLKELLRSLKPRAKNYSSLDQFFEDVYIS